MLPREDEMARGHVVAWSHDTSGNIMSRAQTNQILSIRTYQVSHNFGIELPNTVEQACALDAKNGNTLCSDAISKEMVNVSMAFEVFPDGKSVPIG